MTLKEEMFELAWSRSPGTKKLYEETLASIRKEAERGQFSLTLSDRIRYPYPLLKKLSALGFNYEISYNGITTIKWS